MATDEELFRLTTIHRVNDMRKQALADLIRSAYRRHYRNLLSDEAAKLPLELQIAVDDIGREAFVSDPRGRKKDTRRWWITISAKDPVDHYKFWTQMQKCIKKAQLKGVGKYVLEQRSEPDQEPYGWHIHWLVEFEQQSSKAVITQQVYQCFKTYLSGANYIDVKGVYTDDEWSAREMYMSGHKKPEKMGKVQQDQILRQKYGYPDIICH